MDFKDQTDASIRYSKFQTSFVDKSFAQSQLLNLDAQQFLALIQDNLCHFCQKICHPPLICKACQKLRICQGCQDKLEENKCSSCQNDFEPEDNPKEVYESLRKIEKMGNQIKKVIYSKYRSTIAWDQFKKVKVSNFRPVRDSMYTREYIVYKIEIDDSILLERRYNDFLALHQHLIRQYQGHIFPVLPPKHSIENSLKQMVGDYGYTHSFLNERREKLEMYLQLVYENKNFKDDVILEEFLTKNKFNHPEDNYYQSYMNNILGSIQNINDTFTFGVAYLSVKFENPVLRYSDITPNNIKKINQISSSIFGLQKILRSEQECLDNIQFQLSKHSPGEIFFGIETDINFLKNYLNNLKEIRVLNQILVKKNDVLCKRIEGLQFATQTIIVTYDDISARSIIREKKRQLGMYEEEASLLMQINIMTQNLRNMTQRLEKDSGQLLDVIKVESKEIVKQYKLYKLWEYFIQFRQNNFLDTTQIIKDYEEREKNYYLRDLKYEEFEELDDDQLLITKERFMEEFQQIEKNNQNSFYQDCLEFHDSLDECQRKYEQKQQSQIELQQENQRKGSQGNNNQEFEKIQEKEESKNQSDYEENNEFEISVAGAGGGNPIVNQEEKQKDNYSDISAEPEISQIHKNSHQYKQEEDDQYKKEDNNNENENNNNNLDNSLLQQSHIIPKSEDKRENYVDNDDNEDDESEKSPQQIVSSKLQSSIISSESISQEDKQNSQNIQSFSNNEHKSIDKYSSNFEQSQENIVNQSQSQQKQDFLMEKITNKTNSINNLQFSGNDSQSQKISQSQTQEEYFSIEQIQSNSILQKPEQLNDNYQQDQQQKPDISEKIKTDPIFKQQEKINKSDYVLKKNEQNNNSDNQKNQDTFQKLSNQIQQTQEKQNNVQQQLQTNQIPQIQKQQQQIPPIQQTIKLEQENETEEKEEQKQQNFQAQNQNQNIQYIKHQYQQNQNQQQQQQKQQQKEQQYEQQQQQNTPPKNQNFDIFKDNNLLSKPLIPQVDLDYMFKDLVNIQEQNKEKPSQTIEDKDQKNKKILSTQFNELLSVMESHSQKSIKSDDKSKTNSSNKAISFDTSFHKDSSSQRNSLEKTKEDTMPIQHPIQPFDQKYQQQQQQQESENLIEMPPIINQKQNYPQQMEKLPQKSLEELNKEKEVNMSDQAKFLDDLFLQQPPQIPQTHKKEEIIQQQIDKDDNLLFQSIDFNNPQSNQVKVTDSQNLPEYPTIPFQQTQTNTNNNMIQSGRSGRFQQKNSLDFDLDLERDESVSVSDSNLINNLQMMNQKQSNPSQLDMVVREEDEDLYNQQSISDCQSQKMSRRMDQSVKDKRLNSDNTMYQKSMNMFNSKNDKKLNKYSFKNPQQNTNYLDKMLESEENTYKNSQQGNINTNINQPQSINKSQSPLSQQQQEQQQQEQQQQSGSISNSNNGVKSSIQKSSSNKQNEGIYSSCINQIPMDQSQSITSSVNSSQKETQLQFQRPNTYSSHPSQQLPSSSTQQLPSSSSLTQNLPSISQKSLPKSQNSLKSPIQQQQQPKIQSSSPTQSYNYQSQKQQPSSNSINASSNSIKNQQQLKSSSGGKQSYKSNSNTSISQKIFNQIHNDNYIEDNILESSQQNQSSLNKNSQDQAQIGSIYNKSLESIQNNDNLLSGSLNSSQDQNIFNSSVYSTNQKPKSDNQIYKKQHEFPSFHSQHNNMVQKLNFADSIPREKPKSSNLFQSQDEDLLVSEYEASQYLQSQNMFNQNQNQVIIDIQQEDNPQSGSNIDQYNQNNNLESEKSLDNNNKNIIQNMDYNPFNSSLQNNYKNQVLQHIQPEKKEEEEKEKEENTYYQSLQSQNNNNDGNEDQFQIKMEPQQETLYESIKKNHFSDNNIEFNNNTQDSQKNNQQNQTNQNNSECDFQVKNNEIDEFQDCQPQEFAQTNINSINNNNIESSNKNFSSSDSSVLEDNNENNVNFEDSDHKYQDCYSQENQSFSEQVVLSSDKQGQPDQVNEQYNDLQQQQQQQFTVQSNQDQQQQEENNEEEEDMFYDVEEEFKNSNEKQSQIKEKQQYTQQNQNEYSDLFNQINLVPQNQGFEVNFAQQFVSQQQNQVQWEKIELKNVNIQEVFNLIFSDREFVWDFNELTYPDFFVFILQEICNAQGVQYSNITPQIPQYLTQQQSSQTNQQQQKQYENSTRNLSFKYVLNNKEYDCQILQKYFWISKEQVLIQCENIFKGPFVNGNVQNSYYFLENDSQNQKVIIQYGSQVLIKDNNPLNCKIIEQIKFQNIKNWQNMKNHIINVVESYVKKVKFQNEDEKIFYSGINYNNLSIID